jgi:uncharacterized membrane protein YjjP (DUF1212 family)
MKLNDPFGRVGRRQQAHYAAVRQQLQAEGVDSLNALDAVEHRMTRSFWVMTAGIAGIAALIALLLPAGQGITLVFAALALLWAGSHYLQTRLLLKRYRRELDPPAASGGTRPQDQTTDGGSPR